MTAYVDEVDGVFFTDRSAATDEEFRARFDRFGIFDEERIVEEVARAMYETDGGRHWDAPSVRGSYRKLAVAAYRAMQDGGAEEAPPLGAPDESARVARAQADNGSGDWLGGPIG